MKTFIMIVFTFLDIYLYIHPVNKFGKKLSDLEISNRRLIAGVSFNCLTPLILCLLDMLWIFPILLFPFCLDFFLYTYKRYSNK